MAIFDIRSAANKLAEQTELPYPLCREIVDTEVRVQHADDPNELLLVPVVSTSQLIEVLKGANLPTRLMRDGKRAFVLRDEVAPRL